MMRKIFPALVAVIAVTATGCTHDDDQSGVPPCHDSSLHTVSVRLSGGTPPLACRFDSPVEVCESVACDGIGARVGGALSFAACGRASDGIGVQGHECGWGVSWP